MEWNNNVKVVSFMLHCDCESIRFFVTTFISARMFDLKIRNKLQCNPNSFVQWTTEQMFI